uniref:Prolyl 4-hydroxylase alpha-subunit N-terminal domain-containing protein n=1 Tax=Tetranychus urticae TaxID=32264 RepID=T1JY61_TETUR
MKTTIGLIFLLAAINVSLCSTLRELEFIKGLYPHEDIPKLLISSLVNRRIDQVRTLYKGESIGKDAKFFLNTTDQSLQLLLQSMDSNINDTQIVLENYSHIVDIIMDVFHIMQVPNLDYVSVNSGSSFAEEELQHLMDAYIGDIEMVRVCEESLGRSDRVDMNIVDRLKSLSNEIRNLKFYRDDKYNTEYYNTATKTIEKFF